MKASAGYDLSKRRPEAQIRSWRGSHWSSDQKKRLKALDLFNKPCSTPILPLRRSGTMMPWWTGNAGRKETISSTSTPWMMVRYRCSDQGMLFRSGNELPCERRPEFATTRRHPCIGMHWEATWAPWGLLLSPCAQRRPGTKRMARKYFVSRKFLSKSWSEGRLARQLFR